MAYLGEKIQNEAMRFHLTLDAAPTGTPTITITRGQGTALDTPISGVNMTVGASTLEWHYDYTTEASAQVGAYSAKYTAVIDSVPRFDYDTYDVAVADTDSIKTETASIQTDTASIETKVDTVDTVVDSIQTDTTSIETKVDTVETVVDAILVDTTNIETKVDTAIVDIAAVPTVEEIDTEQTLQHGAGLWTSSGAGSGAYNATINVKDDSAVVVPNAYVTIHNTADDDEPMLASGTTDINGDVTLSIAGNIYVRVFKAGFNFTSTAKNITATSTYNVTGVALTITAPSDPELCRLYLFPITLSNQDVTSLSIDISSRYALTKVNSEFVKNTKMQFTYDATTEPDSYYFDAVQGAVVDLFCNEIGLKHKITVPSETTKDLSDLIL